ncbi:hypothetical protein [Dactylosporangium cerinum]
MEPPAVAGLGEAGPAQQFDAPLGVAFDLRRLGRRVDDVAEFVGAERLGCGERPFEQGLSGRQVRVVPRGLDQDEVGGGVVAGQGPQHGAAGQRAVLLGDEAPVGSGAGLGQ